MSTYSVPSDIAAPFNVGWLADVEVSVCGNSVTAFTSHYVLSRHVTHNDGSV